MHATCTNKTFQREHTQDHKSIITGTGNVPTQISNGTVIIERREMSTTHEEADNIIVREILMVAKENPSRITVLSDDTDVFVLMLYFYLPDGLHLPVIMESPVKDRAVIDICKTVDKHRVKLLVYIKILYQKSFQPMLCLDVILWPAALAFGKVLS